MGGGHGYATAAVKTLINPQSVVNAKIPKIGPMKNSDLLREELTVARCRLAKGLRFN